MSLKFHPLTNQDTALKDYVPASLMPQIQSIQLVYDKDQRSPNTWDAIAIRFNRGVKKEELLQLFVKLKPDEYWGRENGYYVFWWD